MKIYLSEITDQETELDFTQDEKWVRQAVQRVDEGPELALTTQAERPIRVHFNLRQVDEVVVVSGNILTTIELICSRCANRFHLECKPSFSALFCKDPDMAGIAYLQKTNGDRFDWGPSEKPATCGKPMGQNQGFARHAHEDPSGPEGRDLDITYLSEDWIDLSEIIFEQLQFQIPFQPLCTETCKGLCIQCGTDMNLARCSCVSAVRNGPFSSLRDLEV